MTRGITEPPLLSVDSSTPAFLEMGEWLKSSAQRLEIDGRSQRSV